MIAWSVTTSGSRDDVVARQSRCPFDPGRPVRATQMDQHGLGGDDRRHRADDPRSPADHHDLLRRALLRRLHCSSHPSPATEPMVTEHGEWSICLLVI